MNRLEFSEGGQPVYLDDLQRLQDNMVKLILSLFPLTSGTTASASEDAALKIRNVRDCKIFATPRHINALQSGASETVQAHKLLTTGGKVYDVAAQTMSGANIMDCYYWLSETTSESRTFEDGTERAVVKSYTATISKDKPLDGFEDKCIAVKDVPDLGQLLALLPSSSTQQAYLRES